MRKLPPLNAVRAFEAAARHESFTRAAEELHVTHGAVSRQVALLESWLGRPLFTRARSQVALTEAGRRYLAEMTPALDRIAVASSHWQARGTPSALLISAPPTFTMRWLIPRISGFQRRHPDVEVKLTTSTAPVNFPGTGYDIAIRGATQPPQGCRSQAFMTETIVPVCHVDLLKRDPQGLSAPADLARQTLIGYATEPYAWADWLQAAGVGGLKPASVLGFEQMYFALQAAAEGLGVVLVPLFLVADDILGGRLCAPFGTQIAKQRNYYASSASAPGPEPLVVAFCDWLLNEGRDTERTISAWSREMGPPSSQSLATPRGRSSASGPAKPVPRLLA